MSVAVPRIAFGEGAFGHRLRQGQGRGGALARAVGLKSGRALGVVDATAGLGRDGFLLASLGCAVTLIERSPVVYAALAEAVERARGCAALAEAAGRITLVAGDAREHLARLVADLEPDVVLVDPMHPERGSALVKQEMRQLRAVVGPDDDAALLIGAALRCGVARVVLKWPRLGAAPAGAPAPSFSIAGRTTRFDVFVRGAPR